VHHRGGIAGVDNGSGSIGGMHHWGSCSIADHRSGLHHRGHDVLHYMRVAVHHRLALVGDRCGNAADHRTHLGQRALLDNGCGSWSGINQRRLIKMTGTSDSYGEESRQHHLDKRVGGLIDDMML